MDKASSWLQGLGSAPKTQGPARPPEGWPVHSTLPFTEGAHWLYLMAPSPRLHILPYASTLPAPAAWRVAPWVRASSPCAEAGGSIPGQGTQKHQPRSPSVSGMTHPRPSSVRLLPSLYPQSFFFFKRAYISCLMSCNF